MTALRPAAWIGGDPLAAGLVPRCRQPLFAVGFLAAILGFLAVLALALGLAAARLGASWQGELAESATLQVFAPDAGMEEQARAALDVLRTTPGVRSVRMVDLAEQERLLEPWLGPDVPIESLPVPLMVEVEIDRTILDQAGLRERLAAEAPGAVYDDHAGWRQPLVVTAGRLGRFALGCLVALGLGMAAVAGMSARATLAGSGAEVATLRLVGARDGFIGGALTHRSTMAVLAGATVGTAAACILLALVPQGSEQGFFLVGIGLGGWEWLLPLLVPPAAALIAWGAGAFATRRGLRAWS